jgi:hypothetical protein
MIEMASLPMADLRAIGGLLVVVILLYWTYERFVGEGQDPVVRSSTSSDTGSASVLLSGSMAVGAMAALAAFLLLSPMGGGPIVENGQGVLLGLGGLVVIHWIVEKEEREG